MKALRSFDGVVEQASEDELANAAARADRTGLYCCPHTGVALAVLSKLIDRGDIRRDDRVVVLSTAHGLKFTDFKVGYHDQTLRDVIARHANPPVNLPPEYEAISGAIDSKLDQMARKAC